MRQGYEDAYQQFIEPVVASGALEERVFQVCRRLQAVAPIRG